MPEQQHQPAWFPLSAAQSGMWYAQSLDPLSPNQNTAEYLRLTGPLDPELFERALRHTVDEVDAFHLRFADGTPPGQRIERRSDWPLHRLDLSDRADPLGAAETWLRRDLAAACDLRTGPVFGQALLRLGEDDWVWYQRVHHIALDGFGYSLVARRLSEVYTALAEGSAPGASPFRGLPELLAEDAAYQGSAERKQDLEYWRDRMAGAPDAPGLAGASAPASDGFLRRSGQLSATSFAALQRVAEEAKASWPELVLAATAVYTSRLTGSDEVVLGVPMMGRMGSVSLRVPAMVMNVLPLRLTVRPADSWRQLLRSVLRELRATRRHQRSRYEDLRRELGMLGAGRALTGPLVNVMPFDYDLRFGDCESRAHNVSAGPVEDLTIQVYGRGDGTGPRVDVDANPRLYRGEEVAWHQRRLVGLLERLADSSPDEPLAATGVLTAPERQRVLETFNATTRPVPAGTLHARIAGWAARTPDATAVVAGDTRLSYTELDAAANRLARHLRSLGAGPGRIVAVAVPRSTRLVVALLAVLRSGAAYLPLDPEYPAERLAFLLRDAAPAAVLTDTARATDLPAETGQGALVVVDEPETAARVAALSCAALPSDEDAAGRRVGPDDPAYVIYTSGSTGRPKGVPVSHAAIDNRLRWMREEYGIGAEDRILQKTPSGFDVSVWEFFLPLREGATLVMARPGGHRDPSYLADVVLRERVTTVHFVPSMLQLFLAEPEARRCTEVLRRVVCSGEALPAETAGRFQEQLPGVRLHNLYGPTEAAVDVTRWEVRGGEAPVPIGTPVWNTRLYVLDAALQPVPEGVPGELYVAGVQLAQGYLGRPELTATRFVPDPFGPAGSRMYRTGDLARWRTDGAVEYLGRTDHQVKIRGLRIEPGEVESTLASRPSVAHAAVVVREDRPGDQRLVGYLVPTEGADLDPDALREELAAELPDFMVPSALLMLDALPLSPNGKLDRDALPRPQHAGGGRSGRPPRTAREQALCELFAEVLDVPRVDVRDGFFDLGGNSLLAARLVARVRDTLGARLTIGAVFETPTPGGLAQRLHDGADLSASLDVLLPLRPTGGRPPLFCFHPAGGMSWCYSGLLAPLDADQPVYGVQSPGLTAGGSGESTEDVFPATLRELAARYVRELRRVRPHGPFRLLGWSVGGIIAQEVAVQLRRLGEPVETVALLDAYPSEQWRGQAEPDEDTALNALLLMAGHDPGVLEGEPAAEDSGARRRQVIELLRRGGSALGSLPEETLSSIVEIVLHNNRLVRQHEHRVFDGDLRFFTAALPRDEDWLDRRGWEPYVTGRLLNHDLPCLHPQLMRPGPLAEVAHALQDGWAAGVSGAASGGSGGSGETPKDSDVTTLGGARHEEVTG